MPGFLKKAEQKLLLNKPGIWSARTHLVLYYGVLFMLLLAVLCFLEPSDLRDYSTTEYWVGFVIIISIIGLTAWLIYLLRFNVFKKYGIIHPLHILITFLLYFISTGTIVLFTYVHPVVESIRANIAFGDDEIVQDINAMNLKIGQIEYNLFQTPWEYDSIALVKDGQHTGRIPGQVYDPTTGSFKRRSAFDFIRLDSTEFYARLSTADSTIKINDTLYLLYGTPSYNFVNSYRADKYAKEKLLSPFEIYHTVLRRPPPPNELATIKKELGLLLQKYRRPEPYSRSLEIDDNDGPFEIVHKKYQLGNINNSIGDVISKKYRWTMEYLPRYVRLFYYFTLTITLLIFIFRHSTVRTFFLSLLSGVLLAIFTAFVLSFLHAKDTTNFALMIIYPILFFIGSLLVWSNRKRKLITGILINLFVFYVPAFPLLIVGWYDALKREQYDRIGEQVDLSYIDQYYFYAEIGGALLLLVLLASYIGKVYRRWYALPED
jgi:hypothetical protein